MTVKYVFNPTTGNLDATDKVAFNGEVNAGSAASPSVFFTGDPDTGLYSPGANQLALSTNGTGRLFIDASGRVGVGTSPSYTLDVNGDARISGTNGLRLDAGGTGSFLYNNAGGTILDSFSASASIRFLTQSTERLRITSTGQLSHIGAGSSGSPAVSFSGSAASNSLVVDSSSRVGIGTSGPSVRFQVQDSIAGGSDGTVATLHNVSDTGADTRYVGLNFRIGSDNGTSAIRAYRTNSVNNYETNLSFWTNPAGATQTPLRAMTIDSYQRVGIGVTGPGATLDVAGDIRSNSRGTSFGFKLPDWRVYNSSSGNALVVDNYLTEALRVDSSNRLLVGTSSARSTLSFASVAPSIQVAGNTTSSSSLLLHKFGADANACKLILLKNRGANADSNGGLSVDDPLGVISFEATDGFGGSTLIGAEIGAYAEAGHGSANDDGPTRLVFSTCPDGSASPVERLRITQSGQTWVGNYNQGGLGTQQLAILPALNSDIVGLFINRSGSDGAVAQFACRGNIVGSITVAASSTAYNTSSDYRLKENVTAVTDGITRLQQLKPSRFNFIADPAKTVDGFIAHEVQTIVPEAITGEKDAVDDDGNPVYQGIDQSKLVPLLTAALQEAVAKIESLEARLTAAGI